MPFRNSYPAGLGEAPVTAPAVAPSIFDMLAQEAGPSEEPAYYVFKTTLAGDASAPDLSQFIDGDSDFMLHSIHGISTGTYEIAITDNGGRPIHSSTTDSRNVVGTAQLPVSIAPALRYPAGAKIGIRLLETSGAENAIELVFAGVRRFRTN